MEPAFDQMTTEERILYVHALWDRIAGGDTDVSVESSFEPMTTDERIAYVQDLWDRIAEEPESVPVSDEMKAELDRRLAAHLADPSTAIPWEQVKAELLRRG